MFYLIPLKTLFLANRQMHLPILGVAFNFVPSGFSSKDLKISADCVFLKWRY